MKLWLSDERKRGMNKEANGLVRERELRFFGDITASLSHEINNVMAIIGELSGLMDDLLLMAEQGRPVNMEKLKNLSGRIEQQVKKGEGLIKRLNRFAHSVDEPLKEFDLRTLMEEIIALAQRFAFLKRVSLETEFTGEDLTVRSDPFKLQQAIFMCMELALAGKNKDESILVKINQDRAGATIETTAVWLTEEKQDAELTFLSVLMKELGGAAELVTVDKGSQSLILTIPCLKPADERSA